jgi:DNA-binding transcriptional ArsR family regulator
MKRDMDLIRRIAHATEALEPGEILDRLEGIEAETFTRHVIWMQEAGLVEALVPKSLGGSLESAMVMRLTWEGCDFLDAVRDEGLWAKAKATVIKPSASFTFGLLKEWLAGEIRQGLPSLGM